MESNSDNSTEKYIKSRVKTLENLSQQKRQRMLNFLENLKQQHTDDESIRALMEIENQLREKKYGLVWEEHIENVDEKLRNNIPVFKEDIDNIIKIDDKGKYNFILEGDNLQSLYLLKKTHKGKIDLIYIDPPYNRGKNDFVYDDDFIDQTDTFRHSKWMSFMAERLKIAYELLSDRGLIFVSIDDNEFASLKMLMDEIFTENLFVNIFIWKRNSSAKTEKGKFTVNTEYVLLYAKSNEYQLNDTYKPLAKSTRKMYNKNDNDGRGYYRLYPLQKPKDPGPDTTYDYVDNSGKVWKCPPKGWRIEQPKLKALEDDGRLCLTNKTLSEKAYWNERDNEGKRIDTLWDDLPENSSGSKELVKIIGEQDVFNNPKPVELIERCLEIGDKDATVLDFFAGSGTTAQAVLELNRKDQGNRSFILCTNNEVSDKKELEYFIHKGYIDAKPRKGTKKEEIWKQEWEQFRKSHFYYDEIRTKEYQSNGILRKVTYPRVRTVITGIRTDGSVYSEGISANLKVFSCSWTPRRPDNYLLSNILCLHIKEMIELKYGIDIDNIKNVLILNKDDYTKIRNSKSTSEIANIWINQNIVFDSDELEWISQFPIKYIPKEFFGQELREVGE